MLFVALAAVAVVLLYQRGSFNEEHDARLKRETMLAEQAEIRRKKDSALADSRRPNADRPVANPASGAMRDTLAHYGLTNAEAARAMSIPRSRLTDIFAGRKRVSGDTAVRFERYLGMPAEALLRLQAKFDFYKAYHAKNSEIAREVRPLKTGTG